MRKNGHFMSCQSTNEDYMRTIMTLFKINSAISLEFVITSIQIRNLVDIMCYLYHQLLVLQLKVYKEFEIPWPVMKKKKLSL